MFRFRNLDSFTHENDLHVQNPGRETVVLFEREQWSCCLRERELIVTTSLLSFRQPQAWEEEQVYIPANTFFALSSQRS